MTTLSRDDAHQLYMGCLIDYDGRLGFVRDLVDQANGYKLAVKFIGETRNTLVDADPDIIMCPSAPYRLGYIQVDDNSVTYLSRSPRRQYQVGWSENNVNGFNFTYLNRMGTRLLENLLGHFPSYEEALKRSIEGKGRVAFDRMFAIENGTYLCYKGQAVAHIRDGVPNLGEVDRQDLQVLLSKAMGV